MIGVLKPNQVFRPGLNEPSDMYIERVQLERELDRTFDDDRVSLLLGASGSGKSWLYKKAFSEKEATLCVIPIPRGSGSSLSQEFEMKLNELGKLRTAEKRKGSRWGFFSQLFQASRTTEHTQQARQEDPLLVLVQALRERANEGPACIVIENAEQGIENAKFLTELSDVIVSMNETPIVNHQVKLLIVSADDSIRHNLQRLPNSEPVMRRLRALPEVSSFTDSEAEEFLKRGFEEKLGFEVSQHKRLLGACKGATDLKPDYLHDYCLRVANYVDPSEKKLTATAIKQADEEWATSRLSPYVERIASYMNENDTRKRVRDKVLYTLSVTPGATSMTAQNVLVLLREHFSGMNFQKGEVTKALNQLSTRSQDKSEPLLRKTGQKNNPTFSFRGPMERVACRFILDRKGDEVIRIR